MSDESVANGAGSGVLKRSSGFVGGRCIPVCGLWRAHDSGGKPRKVTRFYPPTPVRAYLS